MKRISQSAAEMKRQYDAIVIGSGYGGGVAASRLARAGRKVCLLERGREILPGEYPNGLLSAATSVQVDSPEGHLGPKTALFDFRTNTEMNVLIGCGLGGTSLINANVALEIEPRVFKHDHWPKLGEKGESDPAAPSPWVAELAPYYALARTMLNSQSYPSARQLNKLKALAESANAMNEPFYRPPINVNFEDRINPYGVEQAACNNCGDCCSGCNVSAKNTTLMNYLPDAHNHGAEIFTQASVQYVEKMSEGWKVVLTDLEKNETREVMADIVVLSAGTLGSTEILLRSKQRAEANGRGQLPLSDMLGRRFSGNGDVLAAGYNSYWQETQGQDGNATSPPINGIGVGTNIVSPDRYPGPCITGVIDMRKTGPVNQALVIEEGVIPGAVAMPLAPGLLFGAAQYGNYFSYGAKDGAARLLDAQGVADAMKDGSKDLSDLAYEGAVAKTQTYLVMSHDSAEGVMSLQDDRLRIRWPNAGRSAGIQRDNNLLRKANEAVRGQFLPNPLWTEALDKQLITVHPLGGCRMGDGPDTGVVDTDCRVFCNDGQKVHDGLYVMDGAVLPGSAGVNPLLTITALAERACLRLAQARGWKIDYTLNGQRLDPESFAGLPTERAIVEKEQPNRVFEDASRKVGWLGQLRISVQQFLGRMMDYLKDKLEDIGSWLGGVIADRVGARLAPGVSFSETMRGYFTVKFQASANPPSERVSTDFEVAYQQALADDSTMVLHVTIDIPNIQECLDDPLHRGRLTGDLVCKSLADSEKPMPVTGEFRLLPVDQSQVDTWTMNYDLQVDAGKGRLLHFKGAKQVQPPGTSTWWADVTTLFVDVFAPQSEGGALLGKGIIRLTPSDLLKQATTVKISDDSPLVKKLPGFCRSILHTAYLKRFAAYFGMIVFRVYGGLLTDLANFDAMEERTRKKRPLRAPAPREYFVETPDQFKIKLTRYAGGTKGPIILAPGFTVNASSFATDTVDTNLVEYLCSLGKDPADNYDVWLFDYRASPDAGNQARDFTIDDIALYDWPTAVNFVKDTAKVPSVQVLVHCVGSMSFLMAKLKGVEGMEAVRSAISSQLTLHPVANWLNNLKVDLRVVDILQKRLKMEKMNISPPANLTGAKAESEKKIDAVIWNVPVPAGEECTNPCCRRIFAIYGPSFTHSQLNHETHIAMREWFGEISLDSFTQLSNIIRVGHVVDAAGHDTYLPHARRIDIPITFVAGAMNQEFLPETSLRTLEFLRTFGRPDADELFDRHVFQHYAHMDLFIGQNTASEVFPEFKRMLEALDAKAERQRAR